MHILILNQTFYPDVAATAQHMWDLAQHLEAHGHKVSAVTSRMIYGTDRQLRNKFEKIGDIEIHRVPGTRFGKKTQLGRLLDFGSYYLSAAWRLQHLPEPDVILALTSPPMIATLAMVQKQFRYAPSGRPVRFVYHVMDLYPDAAVASGVISAGLRTDRAMRRLTARTLEVADAVIALGRDMKERLLRQYGSYIRAERIHIIQPWSDGAELHPLPRHENPLARELGVTDTFNIVYSGNLGVAHDLETFTDAIEIMKDDPPGIRWLFIGSGKRFAELSERVRAAGWTNVQLLGYQERETLNQSLNLADVHLVSQLPTFTGVVVPSKLFGILAVAKPAIMVGPPDAECSRIIEDHRAGYVIPNGDAESLVRHLRELRRDPELARSLGRNGRCAFERLYERQVACERIRLLLERVVAGNDTVA